MKTVVLNQKNRLSVLGKLVNEVNAGGPRCCYTSCSRCK